MTATKGLQTVIPYLEHVPIRPNMPHETGIKVQLVRSGIRYEDLTRDEFTRARKESAWLMTYYAGVYKEAVKSLDPNTTDEVAFKRIARHAHEFLGVRHHHQLHFLSRSRPARMLTSN